MRKRHQPKQPDFCPIFGNVLPMLTKAHFQKRWKESALLPRKAKKQVRKELLTESKFWKGIISFGTNILCGMLVKKGLGKAQ